MKRKKQTANLRRAIGIDFGTSNCVVAISDGKNVKILPSREGDDQTPSVVSLQRRKDAQDEIVVGHRAFVNWPIAPKDTILSIKRLLGRSLFDREVEKHLPKYSCKVVVSSDGTSDSMNIVLGDKQFSPVQISAIILKKLREDAEINLGEKVTSAVITVPAYFSQAQRAATRQAGQEAGLQVLKILDDPTATAIAYSTDDEEAHDPRYILVYDLGGGKIDISILLHAQDVFTPLSLEGDMWLGGDDFDKILVDHAVNIIRQKYNADPTLDLRAMARLQMAAKAAREQLSFVEVAEIVIPGELRGKDDNLIDVEIEISREQFETMIRPSVDKTVALMDKAIASAGLSVEQIDRVLLAGNATFTPSVRCAIETKFGVDRVRRNVHPKLSVAIGAAKVAAMLQSQSRVVCQAPDRSDSSRECGQVNTYNATFCQKCGAPLLATDTAFDDHKNLCLVCGISPLSYGIQTADDKYHVIIKKGDPYPTENRQSITFLTVEPNQSVIIIPVYGGDNLEKASLNEKQNVAIASLPVGMPQGTPVEVRLWLDGDGVLNLSAILKDGNCLEFWVSKVEIDQNAIERRQAINLEVADRLSRAVEDLKDGMDELKENPKLVVRRHIVARLQSAKTDFERAKDLGSNQAAENLKEAEIILQKLKDPFMELSDDICKMIDEANDAASREDWNAAISLIRSALERSGTVVPDLLRKQLAVLLGNRAITVAMASRDYLRGRYPFEQRAQRDDIIAILRTARHDLMEATALAPSLDRDLKNYLAQIDMVLQELDRFTDTFPPKKDHMLSESQSKLSSSPIQETGTPFVPGGTVDGVDISVTSPTVMTPGTPYIVDIWAHLPAQRDHVVSLAREEAGRAEIRIHSEGPIAVARGTVLTVRMRIEDLKVEPSEKTILWLGEVGKAGFLVTVPKSVLQGQKKGRAVVLLNGTIIMKVFFVVEVGMQPSAGISVATNTCRYQTAFVSYAEKDHNAVLARIQGIKKGIRNLNVFWPPANIEPGTKWQDKLEHEILTRDVMYLFWSEAASRSRWVEWEWRFGYENRGIDFIDPFPLVPPDKVPPPKELADQLHFNDWVLAYMSDCDGDT